MNVDHVVTNRLSQSQEIVYNRYKQSTAKVVRAILRQPTAKIAVVLLGFFTLMAIFAPELAPYDPGHTFKDQYGRPLANKPPSLVHPLGTTYLGRDVLSQWIFGARISLLVGTLAGFSVMVIGTTVGVVSGYYKGTIDLVLMRIVDILYGIPATPLVLIIAMFYGASVWNIIIAFIFILWRTMARVIRSQTLSLAERPFVKSAKAAGAGDFRIMFQHITPNLLPIIFIETTIVIGWAIMLEAGLSFLGLGATESISWGTMLQLSFASGAIRYAWWWVIPPGLSIMLLVMAFYYLSRSLEEITNPEVGGSLS